jgi:two-component system nitrogen regulation sensor histidine kinase NtrY
MKETREVKVKEELKRRRRERYLIIATGIAILIFTYIETHISNIANELPIATNIFVYGLINLNIILLVFLIFLILRNFVKLYFETKSKVVGSKLRTKLILAFVGLSIVPTLLLFFVAVGFINKSIEGWFGIRVEDSLRESLELAQNYYKDTSDRTFSGARQIAVRIEREGMLLDEHRLRSFIEDKRAFMDLSTVEVFPETGSKTAYTIAPRVNQNMVPAVSPETIAEALKGNAFSFVKTMEVGDVVRGVAPITSNEGKVMGVVVASYYVPRSLLDKMKEISSTFESYKQQKILKNPVKISYFTILLLVTVVIIFFAIWIGRYVAKEITGPIHELAEGTYAVASGNLDYRIDVESSDEIGLLVKSFNRMTEDLKASKSRLEEANLDLRGKNIELDRRRRYVEIVLGNVPAGVISIDKEGRITAINKVAEEILGVEDKTVVEKAYKDVLRQSESEMLRDMIKEINDLGVEALERQIRVQLREKTMTILVNLTVLKDERGNYLGMVVVLDDLTHLLKTQRMAAWKEVARRIAHEVKNPLTPIQLSAQRLRKKYMEKFSDDGKVFDECTSTIIRQVEELKTLVNEFSNFARMPSAEPTPNNLNTIVKETMALYESGHRNIAFHLILDEALPIVEVDREQIKRALINLIDNSITSVNSEGEISIETHFDRTLMIARIEVADNGCGILKEDKSRLFEPYFSTKKSGTGLGLTIVGNIVADHNGYIRIKDNIPRGTRVVIELPIEGVAV